MCTLCELSRPHKKGKGKGKLPPPLFHEGTEGEWKCSSILSLNSALDCSGRLTPRTGRFTAGKETRYPLRRRLGEHQCWSGRVRKISPQPGFHFPTVRCPDYIIATAFNICKGKVVPLQAWSGPEGSRKLRFPDYVTRAPAAFTPRIYSWYSFLLEAESNPLP